MGVFFIYIRARFHLFHMFYVWNFCTCILWYAPLLFCSQCILGKEISSVHQRERESESGRRQWLGGKEKRGMCNGSTCLMWDMLYPFYLWGFPEKKSATNGRWKWDLLGVNKRVIATTLLYVFMFIYIYIQDKHFYG